MSVEVAPDARAKVDVHGYFGLSYDNFKVLHRTILQSLPAHMQHRLVAILEEIDGWCVENGVECAPAYTLQARDGQGRFIRDPIPHYNRGRTRVGGAA